ncbi:Carboxylesterase, type B [Niveomyces insectorum RCEF 264]|uniref:Carboxylic ester hydrolase n=1 Tax=Niveomyces insectorum RCEF 264 TaxID=1081102 RepID=A0A167U5L8_9HYPO|nr:Carboxylesterase, type B [Niveomyces insectorum RCEF 264]
MTLDTGWATAASASPAPTVAVKNGSYTGLFSPGYNQDFFLGMPYAQTARRFRQAEPLNGTWNGVRPATAYPPHCVGYGGDETGYTLSEDCLYLNVVRPAGINATAGLPVAVWIHGGGLVMGGSADRRYNLSFIVRNSVEQGTPMLGVSLNYRLSAFGFLCGQHAQDAGLTNIGFHDQRLALHWIQENIAAFGGASDKVVIWGESSGAESVSAHALAYNGRNDGLFRGVVAESGFGGFINRFPGNLNATARQQATYDHLVNSTSACAATVGTAASLDCLRALPLSELNHVLNTSSGSNDTSNADGAYAWPPVLDGDFIADYPHNQLRDGRFVRVPALIGTNSDEGSGLGSRLGPTGDGVNTDDELRAAVVGTMGLDGVLPATARTGAASTPERARQLVEELLRLYPNIQAIGVPGLDKFPVIVAGDAVANSTGLQFRRASALLGDAWMHFARRRASLAWSAYDLPSWSYRFDVQVNAKFGASHFQEVAFVFNNVDGLGYEENPFANKSAAYVTLSKTMSTAWLNFVTGLDPNGKQDGSASSGLPLLGGSTLWPVYNATTEGGAGHNIVWRVNGSHVEPDTYRAEGISWMIDHGLDVFGV